MTTMGHRAEEMEMADPLDPIYHLLPQEQLDRVFGQRMVDIDPTFLGFTNVYMALASIIPKHWTIIDLGCSYAAQSILFKDHQSYIGVDMRDAERFETENTTHHVMPIWEFIEEYADSFDMETTFAICSYVPPWRNDNMLLARTTFKNVFTYYPAKTPEAIVGASWRGAGQTSR